MISLRPGTAIPSGPPGRLRTGHDPRIVAATKVFSYAMVNGKATPLSALGYSPRTCWDGTYRWSHETTAAVALGSGALDRVDVNYIYIGLVAVVLIHLNGHTEVGSPPPRGRRTIPVCRIRLQSLLRHLSRHPL